MKLDARTAPIHNVLKAYLEPKHLAYALRLWSEQFIEKPNLSLKAFVEGFYDRQPLSLRSHELYNELLPAMMDAFRARVNFTGELIEPYDFPDYDLASSDSGTVQDKPMLPEFKASELNRPKRELTAPVEQIKLVERAPAEEPQASVPPPRIERYEVFSLFTRVLCNKVPVERRAKLFEHYGKEIQDCCVYPVGNSFLAWLKGDSDYFEDEGLALDDMSSITHVLYMGMCDYLGPVQADNVLMHAVSTVATQFPDAELNINDLL